MSARRIATAAALVLATTLLGGGATIVAQDEVEPGVSPGPEVGSPMPGESLPPASPAAASPAATMMAGAAVVPVTVQEVEVVPESTSIPSGSVTFEVTNNGPAFEHEFVVVQTDLPADSLPTNEDGSFNE